MIEKGGVLINETEIDIAWMVDDFEQCYLKSCGHNETDINDLSYLRRYIWVSLSVMNNRQRDLEKRVSMLEGKK